MSYYDNHDDTAPLTPADARYRELKALLMAEWMARPDLPAIKAQLAQAKKTLLLCPAASQVAGAAGAQYPGHLGTDFPLKGPINGPFMFLAISQNRSVSCPRRIITSTPENQSPPTSVSTLQSAPDAL